MVGAQDTQGGVEGGNHISQNRINFMLTEQKNVSLMRSLADQPFLEGRKECLVTLAMFPYVFWNVGIIAAVMNVTERKTSARTIIWLQLDHADHRV